MPPPRPATEACSGSLEPGWSSQAQSANTRHPAGPAAHAARRPDVRDRQTTDRETDVRQHHRLMTPGQGTIKSSG